MDSNSTDADWENLGKKDPYWAVLIHDEFRRGAMDESARDRFFETGERHVDGVINSIREKVCPGFSPASALDFGCGVGRLVIPLARRAARVVGVDISPSMLNEARANASQFGLSGVEFVQSDDNLSRVTGRFDLVHSFIVLQHIPCERGLPLIRRLVELVAPGGVGALQFTYLRPGQQTPRGQSTWPWSQATSDRPIRSTLWEVLRAVRHTLARWVAPRPNRGTAGEPEMQMNPYTINPVFQALQAAGVRDCHVEFTDHGGTLGAMVLFQVPA